MDFENSVARSSPNVNSHGAESRGSVIGVGREVDC